MPGAPAGPPLTRRETSAGEGFLESDPSKNICGSGNISMGLGTSPDSQRGSWGSDPTFQAPISLCVAASPCRASHHPQASSSHQPMPFPSWPAVKPVSWWICGSPCDLGQMVPINISYHGAIMAPASHTSACRSHSTQHLSASCRLGLHSPTPMPSAQHPPVSPDFPRREVPLHSCSKDEGPQNIPSSQQAVGA